MPNIFTNDLGLLSIFSFVMLFIVPLYTVTRNKMVRNSVSDEHTSDFYSKSRISKIAFINISLVISILIYLTLIIISIKTRGSSLEIFSPTDIFIFLVFFFFCVLISYGSGMYIISIVKEQFTTKSLANHPEYKILYLTNEYFHGPISHVLMYSGGFVLFLLTAILETKYPFTLPLFSVTHILYIFNGIVIGGLMLYSQFYNLTWKNQMPWILTAYLIYLYYIISSRVNFISMPFNLFFITFGFIMSFGLLSRHIMLIIKNQYYKYDHL